MYNINESQTAIIVKGDDVYLIYTVTDADGNAYDLTNKTVTSELRTRDTYDLLITGIVNVISPTNGKVQVWFPQQDTSMLLVESAVTDLKIVDINTYEVIHVPSPPVKVKILDKVTL